MREKKSEIRIKKQKNNQPRFVYDHEGKKIGILLTYAKFEKLMRELEDYSDYKILQERKNVENEETYTSEEVMTEIFGRKK
jgi:hypothetical protein